MALSPLQKSLLASTCVSSVLFAVSTAPLAFFNSLPIEVQVRNQSFFSGEVNDLAGPYLGITGAISVALGAGILGISGWRSASNRIESEKGKNTELERNLLSCKAELERIKFSEARLKTEHLEEFLEAKPFPQRQAAPAYHVSAVTTPAPYELAHSRTGISHQPSQQSNGHQPYKILASTERTVSSQPVELDRNGSRASLSPNREKAADNQLEVVLDQIRDLMERVESLQAENSDQVAA